MGIMHNFTGNGGDANNNNNGNNSGYPPTGGGQGGMPIFGRPGGPNNAIDPMEYLIDYNEKFKMEAPVMFRDEIIRQTLGVLIGKNKPNALLIGPAGTGKTKIAEDIARRLAIGDPLIPPTLSGYTIYELPLSNIVAGSGIVGDVEMKIKAVIQFMEDPSNKAILFIDEIHQLANSSTPTYQKLAQIMKPALARGSIRAIGATTNQEAKDLMDDPALNRRFSRLIVDELTQQQTIDILNSATPGFIKHYANKIRIDTSIFPTIVKLADEYRPAGAHRPDNALTLMDRAIGDTVVMRRIQEIKAQEENDKGNPIPLQMLQANPLATLTEKQVKTTAIRLATGNSKPETLDVDAMRSALSVLKGQDDILDELVKQMKIHDMNLWPHTRPLTMLFIGPSGVGKTEATRIIAKCMTGVEPIIMDMTEYNSPASINRIIGSPAGYVGSDSHAELPFDCLESNPYQIILLDEFEKCDAAVQRLFMSAFENGWIKTSRGATVDFSKSIIIATTNAGHHVVKHSMGFTQRNENTNKMDIKELSPFFDIALLNRFKLRLQFHSISRETYGQILAERYKKEVAAIKATHSRIALPDELDADTIEKLTEETYAEEFGARPVENTVKDYIVGQIA